MKTNRLTIQINRPVADVFEFTITPPNSTKWIPGVIKEETNEWPIKVGTVYKLQTNKNSFAVTVVGIKINGLIEWISADNNYHCRYLFRKIDQDNTELEYYEWVDSGEMDEPFPLEGLQRLKTILEI